MWILLLPLDLLLLLGLFYLLPALFVVAFWVSVGALCAWVLFWVIRAAVRSAHSGG